MLNEVILEFIGLGSSKRKAKGKVKYIGGMVREVWWVERGEGMGVGGYEEVIHHESIQFFGDGVFWLGVDPSERRTNKPKIEQAHLSKAVSKLVH